jgi:hypothetical protein
MVSVNNGVKPHPDPQRDNRFFRDRNETFEPFPPLALPDDTAEKKEAWWIMETLGEAIGYIDPRVKDHKPCNDYFRRLPLGRTFQEIWNDADVWINYNTKKEGRWGFLRDPKDVVICKRTFGKGYLFVAATIVHELAHIGGAPGTGAIPPSNAAETALKHCLLAQMFDPDVFGMLDEYHYGPEGRDNDTAYA